MVFNKHRKHAHSYNGVKSQAWMNLFDMQINRNISLPADTHLNYLCHDFYVLIKFVSFLRFHYELFTFTIRIQWTL